MKTKLEEAAVSTLRSLRTKIASFFPAMRFGDLLTDLRLARKGTRKVRLSLESLEARLAPANYVVTRELQVLRTDSGSDQAAGQVVFFDSSVTDYQMLEGGLAAGIDAVVLDAGGDGLRQMAAFLETRQGLTAIHVVAHGAAGSMSLGGRTLDVASLSSYGRELEVLGNALAPDGDLLLWSCNVGAGPEGQAFQSGLAAATGADVAASSQPIGSTALGGDWQLEMRTGEVEATVPFGAGTLLAYPDVLTLGAYTIYVSASGASNTVAVIATGAWTATANVSWLHTTSSGTGNGLATFTFDSNTGPTRTGTLTIAGETLTVIQADTNYVTANVLSTLQLWSTGQATPYGIAVDGSGNVYVADTQNNAIYKWSPSGGLATLVTGLNGPKGVAVDVLGNVYIADTGNNALKRWDISTQTVTTLVSSGLNRPEDVAVDVNFNVFIADTGNSAIKKWNGSALTTVSTAVGPQGVAVDNTGNVYFSDPGGRVIYKWNAVNGKVALNISLPSGSSPSKVAVDSSSNVYFSVANVAGGSGRLIQKWSPFTGLSSLVDGVPQGVAVDATGQVYIANLAHPSPRIEKYGRALVSILPSNQGNAPFSGSLPAVIPSNQSLTGPFAPTSNQSWLTITGVTNGVVSYLMAANNTGAVRTANLTVLGQTIVINQAAVATPTAPVLASPTATSVGSTTATLGGTVSSDGGFPVIKRGVLYSLTSVNSNPTIGGAGVIQVNNASATTGAFTESINGLTPGSSYSYVAFATNVMGATYTSPVSTFTTLAASPLSGLIEAPAAGTDTYVVATTGSWTATANDSWLHTTSSGTGNGLATFTFDANTGATRTGTLTIAGQTVTVTQAGSGYVAANPLTTLISTGLTNPNGVAVDSGGNLYITDLTVNQIKKWNATTQTLSTIVSTGLNGPLSVAVDGTGNLYIADSSNSAIKKWNAGTGLTTLVSGLTGNPSGVAVDGAGNVYFSHNVTDGSTGNVTASIKKWTASTQLVSDLVSGLSGATAGVALDRADNVYFIHGNLIKKWNATTGVVSTLVTTGLTSPSYVSVDSAGKVFITDTGTDKVKVWNPATSAVTDLFTVSSTAFLRGVAVDGVGNVYAIDNAAKTLMVRPRAFVPTSAVNLPGAAGSNALLPVLPTSETPAIFVPTSNQSWLTVGSVVGGVVNFSFTANTTGAPRSAQLTVLGQQITVTQAAPAAPTVASPTVASITGTAATLGGTISSDGGAPLSKRGVLYALTSVNSNPTLGGAGVVQVDDSATTTGAFTMPVTGLAPLSGYSYVAFATNSVGTSYSPVGAFTTLAAAPSVTEPTAADITASSATLGGNVTSDGGAAITKCGILYALTSDNSAPTLGGSGVTELEATGTTGVFTVNATGLAAGAGYSYVAFATNSTGASYTAVATFTTGRLDQTITFDALADKTFGDADFTISATASSGLPVTFTATGNVTITGNLVHITGGGSATITAHQAGNSTYNAAADVERTFTITIIDLNDQPTDIVLSNSAIDENAVAGSAIGSFSTSDPDAADTHEYTLVSGDGDDDNAAFSINGDQLTIDASPDFETQNSYTIRVRSMDNGDLFREEIFVITITDVNDNAPVITTAASKSVAEGQTHVVALTATDADTVGGPVTFSISGGADQALFDISGGNLVFRSARNFETDANSYQVQVTASDGVNSSTPLTITVTLTDVNDSAPVITTASALSVAEGETQVATLAATDADTVGGPVTFSISGGADQALFDISDGNLVFRSVKNFETDAHSYQVQVTASDGVNSSTPLTITVTLTDVNDTAPAITTASAQSVAEGQTQVAALTATDADTVGGPVTFSISGGADQALFDIAGGNLVFLSARDFETNAHSYQVQVTASDGVNSTPLTITVTLTDVNDTAPVITTSASQSVAEGQTQVAALTATDADTVGGPVTFSISGGADQALFDISGGNLVFRSAKDFETDAHSYQVQVTASDGVNSSTPLTITVTLTDVNDTAPAITTASAQSVAEGQTQVAALTATDADTVGGPVTFSISGGADQALFDISGGNLVFLSAKDFETNAHSYQVQLTASDGVSSSTPLTITVTLTDVNDSGPVIELSPAAASFTENGAAIVIDSSATVSDPDTLDFDTGKLTIDFSANGTPADILSIRNQGKKAGQIGVVGSNVTFGGIIIGAFSGGGSGTALVITFNGSSTPAAAQALMRNITYGNASEGPSPLPRTVRFALTDGDGGASNTATKTVNVTAINDAPVLTTTDTPTLAAINEDDTGNLGTRIIDLIFSSSPTTGIISDPDLGAAWGIAVTAANVKSGVWEFTTDGGDHWAALGAVSSKNARLLAADADTRLRFLPNPNFNGTVTKAITFRAWDQTTSAGNGDAALPSPTGKSAAFSRARETANITVNAANDAPINKVPGTQTTPLNMPFVFANQALAIADAEAGKAILRVTLTVTNGALTLGATTGITITAGANGTSTVTFSGGLANLNKALNNLRYTPTAGFLGTALLTLTTDDLGNGSGGAQIDTDTVEILVGM